MITSLFNKNNFHNKIQDVPNSAIKLMLFPFSLAGAARRWLEKEPPRSILTWDDLVSKFINEFFPPLRTINLRNEISTFQQRFGESFHVAWDRYKYLLHACPHHGFTELHQLDTFYNAINLTDQDSFEFYRTWEIFLRTETTPPPASIKAVEEIYVTCGGAHPYYQCLATDGNTFRDNIQEYVLASAVNYNQDTSYQALTQQNQVVPLSELEKIKKINEVNIKAMQTQINNVKNELRNEMQTSIKASMSNQTNGLKNMMASFFQMNTASTSGTGSLPSNTIANPKGELKAITTRSGLVLDGPSIPMPPPFINLEEDERVEETLTDPELLWYTIKVPPPLVQKTKPTSLKNYVVHKRDPLHLNFPYPSRMHQEKQQEKDEVQIHKFWQIETLELANNTLNENNENCSLVILKKLPEKLGDPGKFLIQCSFSELKCKDLADLGASMTLKLANRAICTPAGIARDVFVQVGKFTFPADFVIVNYERDPRVPLILGRPFLRNARALIDVHGEEMILHDGDERLIFNMRHDTSSYSNKPKKESINMIDIYNVSYEDYLEDFGNPTPISEPVTESSSSPTITSLEESYLNWEEFEAYLASDSFPTGNDDPVDLLIEEFTDELALITFPPGNDDLPFDIESDLREIGYLLNNDPTKEMDSILEDLVDEGNLADDLCDSVFYEDVSEVDALPSTNNEDKVFNPGILIHENLFEITIRVTNCAKNVKKTTNASLILEDFNPPLYELPFHKEVPGSETLLSFSSENEEKVFNPGILTSKGVHTSLLPELSHRGPKAFKVIKIFESPMEIFPCSYGEDIRVLDVPCLHFYPP
ncbi:reverse transcriptase domain-containing protein [Tanacetum coccineum]